MCGTSRHGQRASRYTTQRRRAASPRTTRSPTGPRSITRSCPCCNNSKVICSHLGLYRFQLFTRRLTYVLLTHPSALQESQGPRDNSSLNVSLSAGELELSALDDPTPLRQALETRFKLNKASILSREAKVDDLLLAEESEGTCLPKPYCGVLSSIFLFSLG